MSLATKPMATTTVVPYEAYIQCLRVFYQFTKGIDTKNFTELQSVLAPTLSIDFSAFGLGKDNSISAADLAKFYEALVGSKELKTAHLLGLQEWTCIADDRVQSDCQVFVLLARTVNGQIDPIKAAVHGLATATFEKIGGQFKLASLSLQILYTEGDTSNIFGPSPPQLPSK